VKLSKKLLVLACLLSTTCMPAMQHERSVKAIQRSYLLDEAPRLQGVLEAMLTLDLVPRLREVLEITLTMVKMSVSFEKKYSCQPRLRCTTCHQEAIYRFLTETIAARTLDENANPEKINAAKSLMVQTLDVFANKELDEIGEFMEQTANEIQMPCEKPGCSGTHWEIVH
jgi:hypothetical protein